MFPHWNDRRPLAPLTWSPAGCRSRSSTRTRRGSTRRTGSGCCSTARLLCPQPWRPGPEPRGSLTPLRRCCLAAPLSQEEGRRARKWLRSRPQRLPWQRGLAFDLLPAVFRWSGPTLERYSGCGGGGSLERGLAGPAPLRPGRCLLGCCGFVFHGVCLAGLILLNFRPRGGLKRSGASL